MKIWINADGGSDQAKLKLSKALEEKEYPVYVGKTYSNAHYEDYFNVPLTTDIM